MSKELAKKEEALFPALTGNSQEFLETLKENLGGDDLSPFDLDRVSIPTGGGVAWTIPTIDGGVDSVKELVGIIIGVQKARAYWRTSFANSGGGSPPDCISDDGITGLGDPGGACATCPYAEFGSKLGEDGLTRLAGQACRQITRIFLLRPDSMLPLVVNLPPSSIKSGRKYLLRLAGQSLKFTAVVSRLTLEQDKSKGVDGKGGGIAYSKAVFAMVGKLDQAQAGAAAAYAAAIAPALRKVEVEVADFGREEDGAF
jgi:hypothetical protein